uniref:Very long-chain fatty acid transport protein n=1 Tax=Phallusia mammillata TaxID=59560 RepID=A0A6F9DSU6_9ASCI|nr:long-chain fatty acid transport protein 4 [Phallusia mammillata]
MYVTTSTLVISGVLFGVYLATGGWKFADVFVNTIRRDLWALKALLTFKILQQRNTKHNRTIPKVFEETMRNHPKKIALQWEDVTWTYQDLFEHSNCIANYFRDRGLEHGDVVAIYVGNRPEFVALWLGLARIGVTSALINFNLHSDALAHCINISFCKALVYGGTLTPAVKDVKSQLKGGLKYFSICNEEKQSIMEDAENLDEALASGCRLPPDSPKEASIFDKLMYIYTSGTTGLPKAAVITHCRYYYISTMSHLMLGYKSTDKVYCSLPLYHSNGGIVGLGQCLCHGIPLTIRSKFSARNFWTDCKKYNCTVILYIGEICRYLLAQPSKDTDRDHSVRVAAGNGLRPEIWKHFVERFNIGQVAEFYGATEGNANMMNVDNRFGSCGFISMIAPSVYPLMLLKIDEDKELVRGRDGLCIKCEPGDFGMLVGKIIKQSLTQRYDGYADEQASKKKVAYDVFQKGDSVFMTGDVLTMDKYGNMYFKDRTGDTFRWKGENVSTAECEAELAKVLHNQHTVGVYGVDIPGAEGKAGMACIMDPNREADLELFYAGAKKELPSYALPLFVRLTDEIEVTGTHKIKKVVLRRDGYDIGVVKDPIFFLDAAQGKYVPLDTVLYEKLMAGLLRV